MERRMDRDSRITVVERDAIRLMELSNERAKLKLRETEIEREIARIWAIHDHKLPWDWVTQEQPADQHGQPAVSKRPRGRPKTQQPPKQRKTMVNKGKTCSSCNERPAKTKGMCNRCYMRSRQGTKPRPGPIAAKGDPCVTPGCTRAVDIPAFGHCWACYKKKRRHAGIDKY